MGIYYTPFTIRVDEEIIKKMKIIASVNKRSANKEVEFVLEQYIKKHEEQYGEIITDNL